MHSKAQGDQSDAGNWGELPAELLARILLLTETTSAAAAVRGTCAAWRSAIDNTLYDLKPSRWPHWGSSLSGTFPRLRALNLLNLFLDHSPSEKCKWQTSPYVLPLAADSGFSSSGCSSDSGSGQPSVPRTQPGDLGIDLMGAVALLPCSPAGDARQHDCLVAVKAGVSRSALTAYVASRWPQAAPPLPPLAATRIWRDLPALHNLQSLAINGSMLLVQSIRTLVDPSPDGTAEQPVVTEADCAAHTTVTHIYTLALPQAICQLTQLQSLTVDWHRVSITHSISSSSSTSATVTALHGNSIMLPHRRRSYEPACNPEVVLVANPQMQLPANFSQLSNLRQLELAGSFSGADSLKPLLGLSCLHSLTLGPGDLDMQALMSLAKAGALLQLQRLALRQHGAWDACAVAHMLAGMRALQDWEVQELEMSSSRAAAEAAIPPEARLTAAAIKPLAATLTRLSWTTCSQRLTSGASLLGRTPVSHSASTDAAFAWLGGCSMLRMLSIAGEQTSGVILNAPVLDALSSSIAHCSSLEELQITGLGVPILPVGFSQLHRLHSLSVTSTSIARRTLYAANASLGVVGACSSLRSIALAGCELRGVPRWLAGLQELTELHVNGNLIQELPTAPAFGLPTSLRVLNLSDNRLRDIPRSIVAFSQLTKLQLDENYLSSLPAEIWQLPALQILSVKENMLPELPDLAAVSSNCSSGTDASRHERSPVHNGEQPQSQQLLHAAEDMEELMSMGVVLRPKSLAGVQCTNSSGTAATATAATTDTSSSSRCQASSRSSTCSELKVLLLADNQLSQLPLSITRLTSLQHLDLGHNQLHSLPETGSIWSLTRLTSLQLCNNHLTKIPAGISRLERLINLDVSDNHLSGFNNSSIKPVAMSSKASSAEIHASVAQAVVCPDRCNAASRSDSSTAAAGEQLPSPLRALRHLKQVRMSGQQVDRRSSHCPLTKLLGGLSDLVEMLRSLAPPGHQCPVTKAAQAAVAHISRVSTGKRARKGRERALLERVQSEPGWVVLPAPSKPGPGLATGASPAVGVH